MTEHIPLPDIRAAIDSIATLRARALRLALFGQLMRNAASAPEAAECLREAREQIARMRQIADVLRGTDRAGDLPPDLLRWFALAATADGRVIPALDQLIFMAGRVLDAMQQDGRHDSTLARPLRALHEFGLGGFFVAITDYCDSLWSLLEQERQEKLARAELGGRIIADAFGKLETLGKHIRLVSINASIEAARSGDNGRGIAVISTEFKSLAEEIQTLSTSARRQIPSL